MQYIKFGNTGMDVSRICLGMMSFGRPGKENVGEGLRGREAALQECH